MNQYERLMYWLFKKQNKDMNLSKRRSGSGMPYKSSMEPGTAYKTDAKWDLANLYYQGVHDEKPKTKVSERRELATE